MSRVLIIIVVVLPALVILLLAVPVDLAFRLERIEAITGQLTIRWLFGLARWRIPIAPGAHGKGEPGDRPAAPASTLAVPPRRAGGGRALALLRDPRFRRRALRFAGDLLAAARWRRLAVHVRLGLDDPADTGRLWAWVGPLALLLRWRHADVRIEPEFEQATMQVKAHGRVLLIPLRLLWLALGFALSPAAIQAWRRAGAGHA